MLTGLALSAWLSVSPAAVFAQEEEEASTESPEEEAAAEALDLPKEQPVASSEPPVWWFGAYLQGAFVPSFMLGLFLDEAPTVANVGFGVTATHRNKDGMSFVIGLGYQPYSFAGPFRISGDPELDTEYLDSTLGLLHVRGQMLWSTEIVDNTLSFEYGVGLDVGVVLGEMRRSEAYRDAAGNFARCAGPGNPPSPYCEPTLGLGATDAYDAEGAHYNVVEKRVPPVMLIPMLPALALRYTPIPELAIKLDAAFGLMQFAIGLSAAYGVNL